MKKLLALIVLILFISMSVIPCSGTTDIEQNISVNSGNIFYVGGSGPGNYSTIQEAINDSSDGDTIFVYDDSAPYYENLIVDKSINLIGEDKETTVIDGSEIGDVITISVDWVNISRFTIQNSGSDIYDEDAGIKMQSNYSNISGNNIILNNCNAIRLDYSKNNIISGNSVIDNRWGIILEYSLYNIISGNNIKDNKGGSGITLDSSNFNSVSDNHLISNGIIFTDFSSYNNIIDNRITGANEGISTHGTVGCTISGNIISGGNFGMRFDGFSHSIIHGNKITNNKDYGIFCTSCKFNTISCNDISNSYIGLRFYNRCSNNIIYANNFNSNKFGIRIDDPARPSNNCTLYHNNFFNNSFHAVDGGNNTIWDDGYPSGGNYWDDYDGIDNYSGPNQDIPGSDGIGDTPYSVPGPYKDWYPLMFPWIENPISDLSCDGILSWSDVSPVETVHGSFTVENIGERGSLLDWKITNKPSWGTWTFDIEYGEDLTPEDGQITINVSVVAPNEQNEEFTGSIRVVNQENSSDYCKIDVSLSTPRNKNMQFGWLERFPLLQRLMSVLGRF